MDTKKQYLVMETHYDNPGRLEGVVDTSGIRIHYTDTPRKHMAGSLQLGDPLIALSGMKVRSDLPYQMSCPSECTSRFQRSITVFASFLHMHTTGREIYTNLFEEDESFVQTVNSVCTYTVTPFLFVARAYLST